MQIDLTPIKHSQNAKLVFAGLAVITCVVLLYMTINPGMPRLNKADINTVIVKQDDIDIYLPVYGQYISEYERLITAPSQGQIIEVFVRTGADVTKDTVIAKMANPDLQQALYEAQVKLERMKSEFLSFEFAKQNEQLSFQSDLADINSQIQTSKLDVDINKRLIKKEKTSKRAEFASFRFEKLVEMHKLQLNQQKIMLAQQEQHVSRIKTKIDDLNIKAGIDGTLQTLIVEVGQRLTTGDQIGKVGSKHKLIAQINIPQRFAPFIESGSQIIIVDKKRKIKGHITQLGSVVDAGFVVAEASISDALPSSIKPSQPLNAQLFITHKKQALFVEQKPGFIPLSQRSIFTQKKNRPSLHKTTITFGELSNNRLIIASGADEGDELVIDDMTQWQAYDQLALEASDI